MKVYYSTSDCDERLEHEVSDGYSIHRKIEQEGIIEFCADHYFSECDGWESSWPLEFFLHDGNTDKVLATLQVTMEFHPVSVFYARHKKQEDA